MTDKIEEIRARHDATEAYQQSLTDRVQMHDDRATLLAEVERRIVRAAREHRREGVVKQDPLGVTVRQKPPPSYAPVYAAALYPELAAIAHAHGYALAVHGSLARDFDLICVPWGDEPSSPADVIAAMTGVFALKVIGGGPATKPHGRVAYTLSIGFGECACDLSFMPGGVQAADEIEQRTRERDAARAEVERLARERDEARAEAEIRPAVYVLLSDDRGIEDLDRQSDEICGCYLSLDAAERAGNELNVRWRIEEYGLEGKP